VAPTVSAPAAAAAGVGGHVSEKNEHAARVTRAAQATLADVALARAALAAMILARLAAPPPPLATRASAGETTCVHATAPSVRGHPAMFPHAPHALPRLPPHRSNLLSTVLPLTRSRSHLLAASPVALQHLLTPLCHASSWHLFYCWLHRRRRSPPNPQSTPSPSTRVVACCLFATLSALCAACTCFRPYLICCARSHLSRCCRLHPSKWGYLGVPRAPNALRWGSYMEHATYGDFNGGTCRFR
jgi:hypothetical protein